MSEMKQPPHSDDAELAVLGGVWLRNAALPEVASVLRVDDFYRQSHRLVYAAMLALDAARIPIDPLTLSERLAGDGNLEAAGGMEFIGKLGDAALTSANITQHAEIVNRHARSRNLIAAANTAVARSYGGDDPGEVAADLDGAVTRLAAAGGGRARPLSEVVRETMRAVSEAHAGRVAWVETGFLDLDSMIGGLFPGDLVILGGRPGMGKSAFAMGVAEHVAVPALRKGREGAGAVLIFSLEMLRVDLVGRMVAGHAKVSWKQLRKGVVNDAEMGRLVEGVGMIHDLPIFINDETSGFDQLCAKTRAFARSPEAEQYGGLALVIVDYLQLVTLSGRYETREREIATMSRGFKLLSKVLGVPFLVLCQLNRKVQDRSNKRPTSADLRESGAPENDADTILLLHRESVYEDEPTPDIDEAEVIVGKCRNGQRGIVRLLFNGPIVRFENRAGRDY